MVDYYKHKKIFETALTIRFFEEKILSLFSEGKINGTVHTCVGQELSGVCIAQSLISEDFILSNHRGHGHYIAQTGDVERLLAEIMGKESGICAGIGGSQHICNDRFLSNGIQGGMIPIAAGIAYANQIKKTNSVVVAFLGEGTFGEGVIYETFNVCSLWNLPVLFVLENNGYSQSTNIKQAFYGSVRERIGGFGIEYFHTDTWNIDDLLCSSEKAVSFVRENKMPCLLEVETYRLNSHSKGDDNRFPSEIEAFRQKDLLNQLLKQADPEVQEKISELRNNIDQIAEKVQKLKTLDKLSAKRTNNEKLIYKKISNSGNRINDIIYETFNRKFSEDERYLMIGEDIEYITEYTSEPYGGAFKVSKDLSVIFPGRIRNTPISEAAITGIGTGLAINGMRPIVEIMFGDFMTLAFDQILNHASKFRLMYNNKLTVPLIIRTPMGGKRGYGPTHSQSLEKYFLGIPDLNVVVLNHRISPDLLYNGVFDSTDPTLVIENKVLYTRVLNQNQIPGFLFEQTDEKFPTLRITPEAKTPVITILCYGGMLEDVEKAIESAFDEEEILCEVICPSLINPLNPLPVINSVKTTKNLLIVEEGTNVAALGSEISALLMENGSKLNSFSRISNNSIIPCSHEAEKNVLPNTNSILVKLKELIK